MEYGLFITIGLVYETWPPLDKHWISLWNMTPFRLVYGTCLYSHIHVDTSIKEYNHLQHLTHYAPIQVYQGTIGIHT